MRGRNAAASAVLLVALAGCADASPEKEAKEAPSPRPTIADYVGKTKSEAEDDLSPSMTLRAYEDAETKADRSDSIFDAWIICKQDAHGDGPVMFSVAATRAACGLPTAPKGPEGSKSPDPSSDASDDVPSSSDKDEQYADAVKVRAPDLRQVEADDLGVQGQLVCTELDAGDSPREVLKTIQAAYPGAKGLTIVTEAPPVYCPSHESAVASALK
ncbi:DUF732 domain-containing protein [Streptomyces auratus]|uniref:DUF732 domain-containing protein n=2 Tax=Streptomyces auratus AGR0001 TaxID=1160718 RepID=A0A8B1NUJ7_9ACTN|nr:DUF732 domain-containing protein [Streptomyces auratus]QTZ94367.1 DUF732 domain-containing protein [Streptomyces auratus AGR0001]